MTPFFFGSKESEKSLNLQDFLNNTEYIDLRVNSTDTSYFFMSMKSSPIPNSTSHPLSATHDMPRTFLNHSKHILLETSYADPTMFPNVSCSIVTDISNSTFPECSPNDLAENTTSVEFETILPPFQLWQTVIIGILCSLTIILTISGNILVISSFIVERAIRQPSNYFIASLAVTDLLIGSVSMPFYTVYVLMGQWTLGPFLCDLWLSVDYTVCLVSQYTVLLITIDRFCSVKIAAKYRTWRTRRKVLIMVAMTWIIPACLFFTSIFGWEYFLGYRDLKPHECAVQFLSDPIFNTALIVTYYWITLVVLIILYSGIYKTAYDMQKKSEAKHRRMQTLVALSAGGMAGMAGRTAGFGIAKAQSAIMEQDQTPDSPVPGEDKKITRLPCTEKAASSPNPAVTGCSDSLSSHKTSSNTKTSEVVHTNLKRDFERSERSSSPAFESDDDSSTMYESQSKAKSDTKEALTQKKSNMQSPDALPNIPEQGILDTYGRKSKTTEKPPPVPPRNFGLKLLRGKFSSFSSNDSVFSPVGESALQKGQEQDSSKIIKSDSGDTLCKGSSSSTPPTSLPISNVVAIVPIASSTPTEAAKGLLTSSNVQVASQPNTNDPPINPATNTSNSAPTLLTSSCLNLAHPVAYDVLSGLDSGKINFMDQTPGASVLSVNSPVSVSSVRSETVGSSGQVESLPADVKELHRSVEEEGRVNMGKSEPSNLASKSSQSLVACRKDLSTDNIKNKKENLQNIALGNKSNRTLDRYHSVPAVSSPVTSTPILGTARSLFKRGNLLNSEDDDLDLSLDENDDGDNISGRKSSEHSTDVVVTSIIQTCTAVTNIGGSSPTSSLHLQPMERSSDSTTAQGQQMSTDSISSTTNNTSFSTSGQATQNSHANNAKPKDDGAKTQISDTNVCSNNSALNQLITTHNIYSNKTKTSVAKTESISGVDKDASTIAGGASDTQSSLKSSLKESRKGLTKSIRSLKKKKKKDAQMRQRTKSENRANKALRTISVILGCFVACWTPYHILAIAESWCKCTNHHIYMFFYWLCYANSPLNPFCYALANHQFKKTFTRILHGDLHYT